MSDVSLPALRELPEVRIDAAGADDAAADLKQAGVDLDEFFENARDSWKGLRTSFSITGLDERVWNGLDLIDEPASAWRAAMSTLETATTTLTGAATSLQSRVAELAIRRVGLASAAASATPEDAPRIAADIHAFNSDCDDVDEDWVRAQEAFADRLRGISGGEADELPPGGAKDADGLDWDTAFGDVTDEGFDDAWMLLAGMDRTETQAWLDAHPEAAAWLASRTEDDFLRATADSSAIQAIQDYLSTHDPHNNPADVARMAELWAALTPAEQEQLLYQYPAVFGSMNGVPFNDRGRVNQVTVQGLATLKEREIGALEARRADVLATMRENAHPRAGLTGEGRRAQAELREVDAALADARTSLGGLREADAAYGRPHHPSADGVQPGYDTLFVNAAGTGAIVTARGQLTDKTQRVMGFTPGTTTTIASAQRYNTSLDGMDGHDPHGTYSIYWAGTQLPPEVPDNLNPRYNREGGPRLAAFDRTLELQTAAAGTDPRKVWTSHSAGAAMVGSGEKQGMVLDAHVYIAPAGPGQGIERLYGPMGDDSGDPADSLPNPHTERYLIQNPKDSIALAQGFQPAQGALGGTTRIDYTGSVSGSSRPDQVFDDVVLLESGVAFDAAGNRVAVVGDGDAGGHGDYLQGDTLALKNVQAVLYEESVHPELGVDHTWWGAERDPVRENPDQYVRADDFPAVPVDQAYSDATGAERP